MILSVLADHPFFSPFAFWATAYCDGVKLRSCEIANEDDGYAICLKIGDDGNIVRNEYGEIVSEVFYGDVWIDKSEMFRRMNIQEIKKLGKGRIF